MTRARQRRKRRSGLAWSDLRHADEVVFCAAWVWLSSDPVADSGHAPMPAHAGRPSTGNLGGNANTYGENPHECWGHSGLARPDLAERELTSHFGSLSEAKRIYETLSDTAKDERPELKEWFREHD